ncbi:unnamed protein product [Allacma fusca]|uniref:Exonuclease domain-containing protein n=1 Tax=Allacma fusca TaxID=39272 RepID=A0A8J2JR98_9HEXA|nr:unnamed protein product [Allacma fusca]
MAIFESKDRKKSVDELYDLDEDEYVDVVCKSLPDLSKPKLAKIKNFIANKRLMLGDKVDQCTGLTSSPRVFDLIYRGDLIPKNGLVFMDIEKLNVKDSHKMVAGTVAIVDARRELILWRIIKQENICQYFPKLTGLDAGKINDGITVAQAKALIKKVLANNTVVGAAVQEDLDSVGYDFKSNKTTIMEIQDYFRDSKGPFRLSDLVQHLFPQKTDFQCSLHSAIADARMTVKVAKRMLVLKRKHPDSTTYGSIQRSSKPAKLDVGDRCHCSKTTKKYRQRPAGKPDWRDFDYNI